MVAITHATPGFLSLSREAQNAALHSLARLSIQQSDDWLYSVPAEEIPGGLPDGSLYIFFVQNETGGPGPRTSGFTAMLGSEY